MDAWMHWREPDQKCFRWRAETSRGIPADQPPLSALVSDSGRAPWRCWLLSASHVILPFSSLPFAFSLPSVSLFSCSLWLEQHFHSCSVQTHLLRLLPSSTPFLGFSLFFILSRWSHHLVFVAVRILFLGKQEGWRRTLKPGSECLGGSVLVWGGVIQSELLQLQEVRRGKSCPRWPVLWVAVRAACFLALMESSLFLI